MKSDQKLRVREKWIQLIKIKFKEKYETYKIATLNVKTLKYNENVLELEKA